MQILLETPSMDSRRAEAQQVYHSQFKRLLPMQLMMIKLQLLTNYKNSVLSRICQATNDLYFLNVN